MTLTEQINKDFLDAYKAKNDVKSSVLRMLKSNLQSAEKEKRSALTDQEVEKIVQKEVKQRNESISEFRKGKREDLAEKEAGEIKFLEIYLPDQMGEDEIKKIVEETIAEVGAVSKADMGKVMGVVMPRVAGKADGGQVSKAVNECLN